MESRMSNLRISYRRASVASLGLLLALLALSSSAVAGSDGDPPSPTIIGDPPCAFGPTACSPPEVHLSGLPVTCTKSDFTLRVRIEHPASVRVRVRVDRKLLRRTRRKRFSVRIPARGLRPGLHRVRVLAVDRYGVEDEVVRRVRRCNPRPCTVAIG
jgi:hypothetical protein